MAALILVLGIACGTAPAAVPPATQAPPTSATAQEAVAPQDFAGTANRIEATPPVDAPRVDADPAASSGFGSAGVADLALILRGPLEVVDVTSNSARVSAFTTLDVVCAVAYGATSEYGFLATDTDMMGSGHSDHGALMTGLQPDTEYHFALGGIGPDGVVYRSEDMTFRTRPLEPAAKVHPSSENLALAEKGARISGVSSNYAGGGDGSAFGANNALDGNPASEWSSQGDGDDAWIEIELAQETHVTSLGFWTRTMGTSAEISIFQVVTDKGETHGPFTLDGASAIHYFDTDFTAVRLRFEAVSTSGGNTGAVGIEVFGTPAP